MTNRPSAEEIDVMLGLDDIAHNRMYIMTGGEFVEVANYGRRNHSAECYCKLLKKLGVKK